LVQRQPGPQERNIIAMQFEVEDAVAELAQTSQNKIDARKNKNRSMLATADWFIRPGTLLDVFCT
jgi:hypothetical protein